MITATVREIYRQGADLKVVLTYSNGDLDEFALNYAGITDTAQITNEIKRRVQSKDALQTFITNFSSTVYEPVVTMTIGKMSDKDAALQVEKEYLKQKALEYLYATATPTQTVLVATIEATRTADNMTQLINVSALLDRYITDAYNFWVQINPQTMDITPCKATDTNAQRLIAAPTFEVFAATVKSVPIEKIQNIEFGI